MWNFAATVEDTEPEYNFGFLTEPHKELYPCAWKNGKMIPEANEKIKAHVLDALHLEFPDADDFIYFTVYGSGASYNWDEDGDFDVQMWVDIDKYNASHSDKPMESDDLVADVRRCVQPVNFPSFAEIGLATEECKGLMLIQYYPKPGTGSKDENIASKPYACYDMERDEWYVKPKPMRPKFYGDYFLMLLPKADDIAVQAEGLFEELQRNTVSWQFWQGMYKETGDKKFLEQSENAKDEAEQARDGIKTLFQGVFQGRAEAYSPEGKGAYDERDLMQKLLEVWGIFQRLKHFARAPLPWEETPMPQPTTHVGALQGLPENAIGPNPHIQQVAQEYMSQTGQPYNPPQTYQKVDPERATRIAQEYENAEHRPDDPDVQRSYQAMINETKAQYDHLVKNGYNFEFYPEGQDPYPNGPRQAVEDLAQNKHLYVYPTSAGYGNEGELQDSQDHPLLQDSGERWNGQPVTHNDIFRGVHDVFGHAKEGVGFRADGEENAWRLHSAMYSPTARPAMTAETRGQNSWVNYGPYGEQNQTANQQDTVYAPQKATVMPDWVVNEGAHDHVSKVSSWDDIMDKAQRLRDNNQVQIINNEPDHVVGTVQGDHGTYNTEIWRDDPQSQAITLWNCDCPWSSYSWGRCVIMGTMITLKNGMPVPIEEIKIFDPVIDHTGHIGVVSDIHTEQYSGEIISLNNTLKVKPTHPVLVVSKDQVTEQNITKRQNPNLDCQARLRSYSFSGQPKFILARDVQDGDFLIRPHLQGVIETHTLDLSTFASEKAKVDEEWITRYRDVQTRWGTTITARRGKAIPRIIPINPSLMRLLGYFIAEGSTSQSSVKFSFAESEKEYQDEVITLLEEIFGIKAKREYGQGSTTISANHTELAFIFKQLIGQRVENKRVPEWLMFLPTELQKEFMATWFAGDGHIRKTDGRYELTTVCPELAQQAELILQRLGYVVHIIYETRIGRSTKNERNAFRLCWLPNRLSSRGRRFIQDGMTLVKCSVKAEHYQGLLYDLTILGNPGFLAEGYAVHNTRQWKKYEGRPCAHTLALYWAGLDTPPQQEGQQTLPFTQQTPPGTPPPGQTFEQYIAPGVPGGPNMPTQPAPSPAQMIQPEAPPPTPAPTQPSRLTQPGEGGQLTLPGTFSSWRQITGAFTNGDFVRAMEPLDGVDDRGTAYIVPRNMVGEVLWSDDMETVVIFSINSGPLGPHVVRVECDTDQLQYAPRGPRGPAPRRR